MKTIIIMAVLTFSIMANAQKTDTPKTTEQMQDHMQMHEKMAKAHQQAADCLKSGKPEDECRSAFMETCKDMDGPGMCGMMGHKKGPMKKSK